MLRVYASVHTYAQERYAEPFGYDKTTEAVALLGLVSLISSSRVALV